MSANHHAPGARALVASHVEIDDPRPSKAVGWLEGAGYQVDVLSRGDAHPRQTGRFFRMGFPPLLVRLASYAFLPSRWRFAFMIDRAIPAQTIPASDQKY